MKHDNQIDFFRAVLICLVILVHIVHFGDLYPQFKQSVLAFMMPAFLVITGYLVNVDKTLFQFVRYIFRILLPYVIMVTGFSILSLYLPVRDGPGVLSPEAICRIVFIRSIGPYWFLHVMIVCGIIYYVAFHISGKLGTTAKFCLFASMLIIVSSCTPVLNIKYAAYYFVGVGVRLYVKDFSGIYARSLWSVIPFTLLLLNPAFRNWGSISVLLCVLFFFSFAGEINTYIKGKTLSAMEYVGRNTFPVYIFHPIFTMLAKYILPAFSFDPTGILHALTTVILGVAGSLCIARLLDRSRLSYVFGRRKMLR